MRNEYKFGFNLQSLEERDGYIGKFVSAGQGTNNIYGILKEVREGYAYFQPSIIRDTDNTLYVEEELPSRLMLPLISVFPIKGSLEEYVKKYNATLKKQIEIEKIRD